MIECATKHETPQSSVPHLAAHPSKGGEGGGAKGGGGDGAKIMFLSSLAAATLQGTSRFPLAPVIVALPAHALRASKVAGVEGTAVLMRYSTLKSPIAVLHGSLAGSWNGALSSLRDCMAEGDTVVTALRLSVPRAVTSVSDADNIVAVARLGRARIAPVSCVTDASSITVPSVAFISLYVSVSVIVKLTIDEPGGMDGGGGLGGEDGGGGGEGGEMGGLGGGGDGGFGTAGDGGRQ